MHASSLLGPPLSHVLLSRSDHAESDAGNAHAHLAADRSPHRAAGGRRHPLLLRRPAGWHHGCRLLLRQRGVGQQDLQVSKRLPCLESSATELMTRSSAQSIQELDPRKRLPRTQQSELWLGSLLRCHRRSRRCQLQLSRDGRPRRRRRRFPHRHGRQPAGAGHQRRRRVSLHAAAISACLRSLMCRISAGATAVASKAQPTAGAHMTATTTCAAAAASPTASTRRLSVATGTSGCAKRGWCRARECGWNAVYSKSPPRFYTAPHTHHALAPPPFPIYTTPTDHST